jgi:aminoglycoside phosphotransferase (APT) family kinase protein
MKMHDGEVDIDARLVRRLVATQFPRFRGLPVRAARSTGTVNAIYRLGDRLCVRLPRVAEWADDLEKEWEWLPRLAPRVSLRVPEPVERGRPDDAYPFTWAIYDWIAGRPYAAGRVADERAAAADLARFVRELRGMETGDDDPRGGRRPLRDLDEVTREAIAAADGMVDAQAATAAWERALAAPVWDGTPAWIHTDLLPPNLLVDGGRLRAVIDFGGMGIGDPAADVVPAWSVFTAAGRAAYRDALAVGDGAWERARGYALHQAAMIIPYYAETNPAFVAMATRTVEQVLADLRG